MLQSRPVCPSSQGSSSALFAHLITLAEREETSSGTSQQRYKSDGAAFDAEAPHLLASLHIQVFSPWKLGQSWEGIHNSPMEQGTDSAGVGLGSVNREPIPKTKDALADSTVPLLPPQNLQMKVLQPKSCLPHS